MTRVVCDFNETLVCERTLVAWCRWRASRGSPAARLASMAQSAVLGASAMLVDAMGAEIVATRIGFLAFRDVALMDAEAWARQFLTLNPRSRRALLDLATEHGTLDLQIVSRGTPAVLVHAFLGGAQGAALVASLPLASPYTVTAPEAEIRGPRLTGRILTGLATKRSRLDQLQPGNVYLGDARDRWAMALADRGVRFVQV